jgi:hypothetical protein
MKRLLVALIAVIFLLGFNAASFAGEEKGATGSEMKGSEMKGGEMKGGEMKGGEMKGGEKGKSEKQKKEKK